MTNHGNMIKMVHRMNRIAVCLNPILTLAMTAAAWACPFCKDSIPASDAPAAGNLPEGFNLSIYFMFAAFFAMLALVTLTLVRGARSTVRALDQSSTLKE